MAKTAAAEEITEETPMVEVEDPAETERKKALRRMNAELIANPEFVDVPPESIGRTSGSRYDTFRDLLIANSGRYTRLAIVPAKEVAQSRASQVRASTGRWAEHTWDAKIAESVETPGAYEVWVAHLAEGQPVPRRRRRKAVAENGSAVTDPTVEVVDPFDVPSE